MFEMQRAINPSIDIYLLALDGNILASSAGPAGQAATRVSVEPILRLLDPEARLPILGDDPRHSGERRIFSAAAVPTVDGVGGYLYVVLASPRHEGISGLLAKSEIMRILVVVVAVAVLFGMLAGLVIFGFTTRRVQRLAATMESFREGGFSIAPQLTWRRDGDEIDRLTRSFLELAARIVSQLKELKQSDVLRRELVANVSHDLKTPLAALQGYVDTLLLKEGGLTPEERRNYLQIASRSGERLSKLVSDLIELAKLDANEIRPASEPFSLAELAQDVAQKFQMVAERRQIHMDTALATAPYVCGDIALIERVLENLMANALGHTDPGGSVRLGVEPAEDGAAVYVEDTGCGIPEHELERIFERFYRVNEAERERGNHSGLGLAIVKSIVELHGSRVEVRSTPGQGSRFSFRLRAAGGGDCPVAR
jgi:signal transduction histidine kinase